MLAQFRKSAVWIAAAVVILFVAMIALEWGANVSGMRRAPYALSINGEEVAFDVINRRVAEREGQLAELSDTARREIYKNVVDEIIAERLAAQEAKKRGLTATHEEIVLRLFTNEQGQMDWGRYQEAQRGGSARELRYYENVLAEDISMQKFFAALTSGLVITPGELDDFHHLRYQRALLRHILIRPGDFVPVESAREFYDAHPDSFIVEERVKGRHILFALPQNASPTQKADARGRAEIALLQIRRGESFNALYEQIKADTSGSVLAQELDWFTRGQMVPAFETVAFSAPVNVPTEIIETPFGYHIALFDGHELRQREAFAEVSEGIRARIAGESEVVRARELAERVRARIEAGEDFAALAAEFSSGKSGANGGLLGEVTPGEMTPALYPDTGALERAGREVGNVGASGQIILDPAITEQLFDLETGKISELVASGHGFHIVKIERRRAADPGLRKDLEDQLRAEYVQALKRQTFRDWALAAREDADIDFSKEVEERMEGR